MHPVGASHVLRYAASRFRRIGLRLALGFALEGGPKPICSGVVSGSDLVEGTAFGWLNSLTEESRKRISGIDMQQFRQDVDDI
jgi:hypothetical protein